MVDADCADNLALLTNTPPQAESLLQSLEKAADGIDLHMNSNPTVFRHFKQKRAITIY